MSKDFLYIIEKKLFLITGILIVLTLHIAGTSKNIRSGEENGKGYRVVSDVICERYERADTPTGFVNEYRFILGELKHEDTLAFYINHHNYRSLSGRYLCIPAGNRNGFSKDDRWYLDVYTFV